MFICSYVYMFICSYVHMFIYSYVHMTHAWIDKIDKITECKKIGNERESKIQSRISCNLFVITMSDECVGLFHQDSNRYNVHNDGKKSVENEKTFS